MKILVLNGSPKRGKSDTLCVTRAFLDGMNEVTENEIGIIDVIDRHIEFCTGCFVCKKNGGTCIFNDDMKELLKEYLESDLIVYSFPLHSFGMPAPLKSFVDRLMPLSAMTMVYEEERYKHVAQTDFERLHYLMICGCGYPNSKNNFEGVVRQFELKFPHNSTIVTVPETPMFNIPQAQPFTAPRLAQFRKAGAEYANGLALSKETLKEITSPMIPEEIYAKFANGEMK